MEWLFRYYRNIKVKGIFSLLSILSLCSAITYAHEIEVIEDDDFVCYYSPGWYFSIHEIKRITDNTFPSYITIQGEKINIKTIRNGQEWPQSTPDSLAIPNGVESIQGNAFKYYPLLRRITLPHSLKEIGENAFSLQHLTHVTIPDSITSLDRSSFYKNIWLEHVDLGKIKFIDSRVFSECQRLSWVEIPKETRIIGLKAFSDCPLFFLSLPATDLNPVVEFERIFGKTDIPFIACPSEILNPGIEATYQTDMPEVFKDRAMIHLEDTSIPVYFSFEPTGVREGRWEPDVDMWPLLEKEERTKEEDNDTATDIDSKGYEAFKYPIEVRIDTSSLKKKQRRRLRVLYNGTDITGSVKDGRFALESGYPYEMKEGKYMFNTLKIVK